MLITRTSPISGTTNSLEVNCTHQQLAAWESGVLIQNAMPNVEAPLREFVKSGVTPTEWTAMFGRSPQASRRKRRKQKHDAG